MNQRQYMQLTKRFMGLCMALIMLAGIILPGIAIPIEASAAAASHAYPYDLGKGDVYYIDSSAADGGSGAIASPYNNLGPINSAKAGDTFLIKAGSFFTGADARINPSTGGTADKPIVVDMYDPDDTGIKPAINAWTGSDGGRGTIITLNGRPYWQIRNLDVSWWNGSEMEGRDYTSGTTQNNRTAIRIQGGSHGVWIIDCNINHIDTNRNAKSEGGIIMSGSRSDNVVIYGNKFEQVYRSAINTYRGGDTASRTTAMNNYHNNLVIKNNYMDRIGGDAINFSSVYNGLVENNTVYRVCDDLPVPAGPGAPSEGNFSGALWSWASMDTLYQYNEVAYTRDGGSGDRVAFDFDSQCIGYQIYQYNYTHHNAGGQMLYCAVGRGALYRQAAYIGNTRIIRYNVSAFESIGAGQSGVSELTFLYNNIFYKSVASRSAFDAAYDQPGGFVFREPGDPSWDVMSLGDPANTTYANYIFNNIFYENEKLTYPSATRGSHDDSNGRPFVVHHMFFNNLIYDTPVYRGNALQTETQLQADGNIIANPKFLGDIDPRNANGFSAVDVLNTAFDSPVAGAGIAVEDALEKIKLDMARANNVAGLGETYAPAGPPDSVPALQGLIYAHIDQRVFDDSYTMPTLGVTIAAKDDFYGKPLSEYASPFIGVGGHAAVAGQPLVHEISVNEEAKNSTLLLDRDEYTYPAPTITADNVTITVSGENLTGAETLLAFGKTYALSNASTQVITIDKGESDFVYGKNYYAVYAGDGKLMKIEEIFIAREPFWDWVDEGLFLSGSDASLQGSISIASAFRVGGKDDSLYYVLAMSEGSAPSAGSNISMIPGAKPIALGEDIEGALYNDMWLRLYTADAATGLITGFASKQILLENIGNIIYRAPDPGVVSGSGFVPMGPLYDHGYRLEFDMQRLSGSGNVSVFVSHNGEGTGSGTTSIEVLIGTGGWLDYYGRNATTRETPGGFWLDVVDQSPYADLHYSITIEGTSTGPDNNRQQVYSMYAQMADGSVTYDSYINDKWTWGTVNNIPFGRTGYSVPGNTSADIRNWTIHALPTADNYASRTKLTGADVAIEIDELTGALRAVLPPGVQAAYEWSVDDPILGNIILGTDADFSIPAGVNPGDIVLTVAGMGAYAGTAAAIVTAPYVTINGPTAVASGGGAVVNYTISARNMPAVNGIELEFEVDGDFVSSKEFAALSGFSIIGAGNYGTPIYWRNAGNIWIGKATLLDMDSIAGSGVPGTPPVSGDFDILELVFNVVDGALGDAAVKLNSIKLSYSGVEIGADIINGSAVTRFMQYYSPYDLNKDGVIDIHDITYALQFLLAVPGDPNWDEAADVNGDGVVEIADLILILANYTVPYYV